MESSIFVFNLSSEERDQSASESKSFVTTFPDFPNEKSFEAARTSCPIAIALVVSDAVAPAP